MSTKRQNMDNKKDYLDLWPNNGSMDVTLLGNFAPKPKLEEKPTPKPEPAEKPKLNEKKHEKYPPIITVDGRVDTDIDHLLDDLNEESPLTDYHGPVVDVPNKYPKPHMFSVIEGSLDDDVDSFANDDGTMEHTLSDVPKNLNAKDLQDVAENGGKTSPLISPGDMSKVTDRSYNKIYAGPSETYNMSNQVGENMDKYLSTSNKDQLNSDRLKSFEKYLEAETNNSFKNGGHEAVVSELKLRKTNRSSLTKIDDNVENDQSSSQHSISFSNRTQDASRFREQNILIKSRYRNEDLEVYSHLEKERVGVSNCPKDNGHHQDVLSGGVSSANDFCLNRKQSLSQSTVCKQTHAESQSNTFINHSAKSHFVPDLSAAKVDQTSLECSSDTESESRGHQKNERRVKRCKRSGDGDGQQVQQAHVELPSFSDESLYKSSEMCFKNTYSAQAVLYRTWSSAKNSNTQCTYDVKNANNGVIPYGTVEANSLNLINSIQSFESGNIRSEATNNGQVIDWRQHDVICGGQDRKLQSVFDEGPGLNQSIQGVCNLQKNAPEVNETLHATINSCVHGATKPRDCADDQPNAKDFPSMGPYSAVRSNGENIRKLQQKIMREKENNLDRQAGIIGKRRAGVDTKQAQDNQFIQSLTGLQEKFVKDTAHTQEFDKKTKQRSHNISQAAMSFNIASPRKHIHSDEPVRNTRNGNVEETVAHSLSTEDGVFLNEDVAPRELAPDASKDLHCGTTREKRAFISKQMQEVSYNNVLSTKTESDFESLDSESNHLLQQLRKAKSTNKKTTTLLKEAQKIVGQCLQSRELGSSTLSIKKCATFAMEGKDNFQDEKIAAASETKRMQNVPKLSPDLNTRIDSASLSGRQTRRFSGSSLYNDGPNENQVKLPVFDVDVMHNELTKVNDQKRLTRDTRIIEKRGSCLPDDRRKECEKKGVDETYDRDGARRPRYRRRTQVRDRSGNVGALQSVGQTCGCSEDDDGERKASYVNAVTMVRRKKDGQENCDHKRHYVTEDRSHVTCVNNARDSENVKSTCRNERRRYDNQVKVDVQVGGDKLHKFYLKRDNQGRQKNMEQSYLENNTEHGQWRNCIDLKERRNYLKGMKESEQQLTCRHEPHTEKHVNISLHRPAIESESADTLSDYSDVSPVKIKDFQKAICKYSSQRRGTSLPRKTETTIRRKRHEDSDASPSNVDRERPQKRFIGSAGSRPRPPSIKETLRAAYKVAEQSMTAAAKVTQVLNMVMRINEISLHSASSVEDSYLTRYYRDNAASRSAKARHVDRDATGILKSKSETDQCESPTHRCDMGGGTGTLHSRNLKENSEIAEKRQPIPRERTSSHNQSQSSPSRIETLSRNPKNEHAIHQKKKRKLLPNTTWATSRCSPTQNNKSQQTCEHISKQTNQLVDIAKQQTFIEAAISEQPIIEKQVDNKISKHNIQQEKHMSLEQEDIGNISLSDSICIKVDTDTLNTAKNNTDVRCRDARRSGPPSGVDNLTQDEWQLHNYRYSYSNKNDYFTQIPPVIDKNVKSISMSRKHVLRCKMVGSCVDPGVTDNSCSDSIEFNSNFNKAIVAKQIHMSLAHIGQHSDNKVDAMLVNKHSQEYAMSQCTEQYLLWEQNSLLHPGRELGTQSPSSELNTTEDAEKSISLQVPNSVDSDEGMAYHCSTRSCQESCTRRRETVHARDGFGASYQLHDEKIVQMGDYFHTWNIPTEDPLCVATLCYTDQSSPVTGYIEALPSTGEMPLSVNCTKPSLINEGDHPAETVSMPAVEVCHWGTCLPQTNDDDLPAEEEITFGLDVGSGREQEVEIPKHMARRRLLLDIDKCPYPKRVQQKAPFSPIFEEVWSEGH